MVPCFSYCVTSGSLSVAWTFHCKVPLQLFIWYYPLNHLSKSAILSSFLHLLAGILLWKIAFSHPGYLFTLKYREGSIFESHFIDWDWASKSFSYLCESHKPGNLHKLRIKVKFLIPILVVSDPTALGASGLTNELPWFRSERVRSREIWGNFPFLFPSLPPHPQ